MNTHTKPILVIGAGITGMTAALETAELGYNVLLVEKEPFVGGRVVAMHRYFPKMCPPTCGFEINIRRMRQNPRITVHTLSTVEEISGHEGRFEVRIKKRPRYITGNHSLDNEALKKLASETPNGFNYGMDKTKAVYYPHEMAYPPLHMLKREALSEADADTLLKLAPEGAVDLDMTEDEIEVEVGSVIVATGWHPYDAAKLDHLGYGGCRNVITNVMMERLAAHNGPTKGEIVRPSDGRKAENVAFVQCAGSRDENHLPYCSAVCCMASLKQARYVRENNPDSKVTIFYIDIRAVGRNEKFYFEMLEDSGIAFVKGKVAEIHEDPGSENLILDVEDTMMKRILHEGFDLVVLATGMAPNTDDVPIHFDLKYDTYGFIEGYTGVAGIYTAGCARHPCDVAKATKEAMAASIKAIQSLERGE
ncbi:MAG: FAD-dependent oxidoreductase [Acidobacteriota bacterium]